MSNEDKYKAAIESFISDFQRWEVSKPFMTSRQPEVDVMLQTLAKAIEPPFALTKGQVCAFGTSPRGLSNSPYFFRFSRNADGLYYNEFSNPFQYCRPLTKAEIEGES